MLIDSGLYTRDIKNADKQLLMLEDGTPKRVRIDQVIPVFNSTLDIMAYEGSRSIVMLTDGSVYDRVESNRQVDNLTTLSVNGDGNSRYILRQAFRENVTRWGVRLGGNVSALVASGNATKLMQAFASGERLFIPDNIVSVGGPIQTNDIPVNISGGGQRSIIRQLDNTNGLILKNRTRLNEIVLDGFILESTIDYGNNIGISIEGSFGYNDGGAFTNVVTKVNACLNNVALRGSDMYYNAPPWKKGWKGGLYIENPQSVDITNFFFQGRGERFEGDNAYKNSDYGIYMKADRLSTDSCIFNPRISNTTVGIDMLGDGPVGRPTLEGVKVYGGAVLSNEIAFRIMNTKYGAPGFEIFGGNHTADRHILYASNIRQSKISNLATGYVFGHSKPGICAFINLDNACSEWWVTNNSLRYVYDRPVTKKPYGLLMAGFNKEVFYGSASVAGTGIEYAVANKILGNWFIGPGAENDTDAIWLQDSAINNEIDGNSQELFARTIRTDLAQNRVGKNHPRDAVEAGVTPIVNNEQTVITIPLLDGNNDPILDGSGNIQYVKRIINRQNEGAVLVPFSGTVTTSKVSSAGLIVAHAVGGSADALGYILDVQHARSILIEIRDNYIAAINTSDPLNPVEVVAAFTGKNIRGIGAKYGQVIRLETKVAVTLKYHADLLPLRGGRDFVLKPGMSITFENTKNGIEEVDRKLYSREVITSIDGDLPDGFYCYDDSALPVLNRIGKEANGYPWYIDVKRLSTSSDHWALETAYNALSGRTLFRIKNISGTPSAWKQIWNEIVTITSADDETMPNGDYLLNATIGTIISAPEQLWHMSHKSIVSGGVTYVEQRAVNLLQPVAYIRVRKGDGWSIWRRDDNSIVAISDANAALEPGKYTLSQAIFQDPSGTNIWHLEEMQTANPASGFRSQKAVNISTGISVERVKAGSWTAWKRTGSQAVILGENQLPDGTFGVAMKPGTTNVQLYYQDGATTRELVPVPDEATTADFLLGYNLTPDKRVRMTKANVRAFLEIAYLNGITTLAQLKTALDALP